MITVHVTEEDIRRGQENVRRQKADPQSEPGTAISESCAIALSLRRMFPDAEYVTWGRTFGWIDMLNLKTDIAERDVVAAFTFFHDSLYPIQPFSFTAHVFDKFGKEIDNATRDH